MNSETLLFLTKLIIEDDEDDDIVQFAFPNQKSKIRCSISMLSQFSPVFEAMFSERWNEDKTIASPASQKYVIQLNDEFATFKLLTQILASTFTLTNTKSQMWRKKFKHC